MGLRQGQTVEHRATAGDLDDEDDDDDAAAADRDLKPPETHGPCFPHDDATTKT